MEDLPAFSVRQYQIQRGVPPAESYDVTMYLMAGLLVVGFICNLAVRPVEERHYMSDEEVTRELGGVAAAVAARRS